MQLPKALYRVDEYIWAGAYLGAPNQPDAIAKLQWVVHEKIDVIIDLTTPADGLVPYVDLLSTYAPHVTLHAFPIKDMGIPSPAQLLAILDTITHAVAACKRVYIHCWGGIGRTGTVVACWYIRNGLSAADALAKLAQVRSGLDRTSPESAIQFSFVAQWQEPSSAQAVKWHQLRDRYRGALIGLAVGDALGTTLEFTGIGPHGLTDMVGGGPFNLPVGGWTDDTSMALCLAQSLISQRGFDAKDQIENYVRWYREGYLSSTNRCFDIGSTVARALNVFMRTGEPFAGPTDPLTAGNGSLMRLAPIPMYYAGDDAHLAHYAGESSRVTHGAPAAIDACVLIAVMMATGLRGGTKADIIPAGEHYAKNNAIQADVAAVMHGSYRQQPPIIQGTGYVVKSFEAALWAFYHFDDFKTGALAAVNLGQDADTTGAIYGQLAGAVWGESQIPIQWRQRLVKPLEISWRAEALLSLAWPTLTAFS